MLKAVIRLGLSELAPYICLGDCNSVRESISVTSGDKIFMEIEILSRYELTDWVARSPSRAMVDK